METLLPFAQRLVELREKRGLTQTQLAEAAGLTQVHISRLENGRREPSLATARRLADALGCRLDELG